MLLEGKKNEIGNYNTLIDVGCGTGFIGLVAADCLKFKKLYLTDWTCSAYLFSIINFYRNFSTNNFELNYLMGLDFEWINQSEEYQFDFLICNPPYLPIPEEFSELQVMHTVAGVDLLSEIIKRGHSFGREIYIQFSDIAKPFVFNLKDVKNNDIILKKVPYSDKTVPFRVRITLEKEEYINWLLSNGLNKKQESAYLYDHNIEMYSVFQQQLD